MKKIKTLLASLAAVIMTAGIFTGCGSSTSTSTSVAKTDSSEKTTVTIWHYFETESQQAGMDKLVNDFNASQDKIKVEAEFVPRAELTKQFTIGLVADKLPDIGVVDNPDMASFAAMGLFSDITDKVNTLDFKDQYYAGPLSSCTLDSKYYGLPFGSNDLGLFYNKEMLDAAGIQPPTTWDELKDAAKKLTKGDTYGLAIAAPKSEEGTFQYLPWLLSTGAKFNEIGTPDGIKSLQYITDIIKDGSMSKEVINWTQNDLEKQFATKKAAMIIDGPWILSTIKTDAPNLKYDVTKIPKDKIYSSGLGGENWGIIKGHHEAEAWEFIKYTQQKDTMLQYANAFSYIPARKDVAESDEAITKDPIMKQFLEELQYAMPRGPHAKWPQVSEAIFTAMQESFTNAKTPEQAAKDAQGKIDEVLK